MKDKLCVGCDSNMGKRGCYILTPEEQQKRISQGHCEDATIYGQQAIAKRESSTLLVQPRVHKLIGM